MAIDNETEKALQAAAENRNQGDGNYPDRIKFEEEGETAVGVVLRVEQFTGQYGPSESVVLKCDDGVERSFILSSATLKTQWAKVNPQVGNRVAVRFLGGRVSAKTKRIYKDFVVVVLAAPEAGGVASFVPPTVPASQTIEAPKWASKLNLPKPPTGK